MTKFMVLSREHHLLPLAHRLRNIEQADTEVIVWKSSFEKAWYGMIEKDLLSSKSEIHTESITKLVDRANAGELIVIHDVPSLHRTGAFNKAPLSYSIIPNSTPSVMPIRLGWWQTDLGQTAMHLLVYDMGAWPGGMGRLIPGALTLINLARNAGTLEFFEKLIDDESLKALEGFRGLVNVELVDQAGTIALKNWEIGWPHLHTQAFMAAVDVRWSDILDDNLISPSISKQYTITVPLSVPPWPTNPSAKVLGRSVADLPIELNSKLHRQVYWHDVWVDMEAKNLFTAGLDGLVGVVHASADTFEGARAHVINVANSLGVKEKQFRSDIGGLVQPLLATVEEQFEVVV